MDENTASGLAAFGVMGTLFVLLLAILWILVPFAIFGIKPLLRDLIAGQRRTNEFLSTLVVQTDAAAAPVVRHAPPAPPVVVAPMVEDSRTLGEIIKGDRQ